MTFNEKQLQILTTAEDLFSTKGFDGTSVRDISEAAGVNVAMISYYFGSKEKLMEALFELRIGPLGLQLEHLINNQLLRKQIKGKEVRNEWKTGLEVNDKKFL